MNINSLVALTQGQQQQPLFSTSEDAETTEPIINETSDTSDTTDTTTTTTTTSTNTTSATTSSAQAEEFTTFLTLLTAQIRNQDPLAPLDSTQFVEQLATFSNLELQAEGNAVLEDIALLLAQSTFVNPSQSEPTT
ncbi:MAG: flagellar hook capping FlgD N-terminal domain-containing protein [Maricaulaceae bacterium]